MLPQKLFQIRFRKCAFFSILKKEIIILHGNFANNLKIGTFFILTHVHTVASRQTILLLIKALQNLPHLQLSETSSQAYPLYDKKIRIIKSNKICTLFSTLLCTVFLLWRVDVIFINLCFRI